MIKDKCSDCSNRKNCHKHGKKPDVVNKKKRHHRKSNVLLFQLKPLLENVITKNLIQHINFLQLEKINPEYALADGDSI